MSKRLYVILSFFSALTCAENLALAETNLDRVLSTVSVSGSAGCSSIDIRFNRAVSYRSHAPAKSGSSIDVSIGLLGTENEQNSEGADKESASVAPSNAALLDAVSYEPVPPGFGVIHLNFEKGVAFRVIMEKDTRHLRIDVATVDQARSCLGFDNSDSSRSGEPESGKGDGPAMPVRDAASSLKAGKASLASKDYPQATAYFTKAVETGSGATKRDALEMLGLAREKAGQMAHARAEYERYLKAYPNGDGSRRVRQRLNAVLAATDQVAQEKFATQKGQSVADGKSTPDVPPDAMPQSADGKADANLTPEAKVNVVQTQLPSLRTTRDGIRLNVKEEKKDPNAWMWDRSGSVAQYYYRYDSLRASDPGKQNYGLHEVFQNEVLTSADMTLRGENEFYEVQMRSSLFNEKGFGEQKDINTTSIGTLYVDGKIKSSGLSTRLGRQSKSTGGVFGRFDGALLGWELDKDIKVQTYAGSPVYRRDAKPFSDDRYFVGASVDYEFPGDKWAGALYAMAQNVGEIIDRRALGAELRFTDKDISIYAASDFDVFYREFNNAYLNMNWRPREGTSIYGSIDFRRVPFLVTSNALMGQAEDDLQSLVEIFGEDSVYELAVDRTATAKTANLGVSQQITKDWQLSLDGTIADYSGTPASGGVDAIPDPGVEYYASLQASGSNVFMKDDTLNLGLRYSGSDSSNFYMADAYYRFLVNEDWRLSPRLRLSMRDSRTSDQVQYLISGSVASRYKINKNWSFETEAGVRWEDVVTALSDTRSINLLATAGYRFEF
jgi:tetratricopeptide (TPR) repeat protein